MRISPTKLILRGEAPRFYSRGVRASLRRGRVRDAVANECPAFALGVSAPAMFVLSTSTTKNWYETCISNRDVQRRDRADRRVSSQRERYVGCALPHCKDNGSFSCRSCSFTDEEHNNT